VSQNESNCVMILYIRDGSNEYKNKQTGRLDWKTSDLPYKFVFRFIEFNSKKDETDSLYSNYYKVIRTIFYKNN